MSTDNGNTRWTPNKNKKQAEAKPEDIQKLNRSNDARCSPLTKNINVDTAGKQTHKQQPHLTHQTQQAPTTPSTNKHTSKHSKN